MAAGKKDLSFREVLALQMAHPLTPVMLALFSLLFSMMAAGCLCRLPDGRVSDPTKGEPKGISVRIGEAEKGGGEIKAAVRGREGV